MTHSQGGLTKVISKERILTSTAQRMCEGGKNQHKEIIIPQEEACNIHAIYNLYTRMVV